MMAVPEPVIAEHDETFHNMLGLVRGRLYYNLLNWYRMLALLPGFQINRRFMEQMMGVKEPLPEALADEVARSVRRGRALDGVYLARTVAGLLVNHATIDRRVDAFYRRLDEALAPPQPPLADRRPDELVAHYRDLRSRLLLRWDAPLVNDFFAMIFYGLLRHLVTRWCGDPAGTLQNDLIGGDGGIVSAEPAVRMQRLARLAAADPDLLDQLTTGTCEQILEALDTHRAFAQGYQEYLARFGDRTVNELKLESTTLHDDPMPLLRAVGALGRQMSSEAPPQAGPGDRLRVEARQRVEAALAGRPFRRAIFQWVLGHARRRVRDRENLRLERTRLFGRVRRIFVEIGRRLHALDLLDDPRDVFYLEVDELLAFVDGRSTCTNLRALATLRQREFREYRGRPAAGRPLRHTRRRLPRSCVPARAGGGRRNRRGTAGTRVLSRGGPRAGQDRHRSAHRRSLQSRDPRGRTHRPRLDHGIPVGERPPRGAGEPPLARGHRRARARHPGDRLGCRASPAG